MNTQADIYQEVVGTVHNPGTPAKSAYVDVSLYWNATRPSEITLGFKTRQSDRDSQVWHVARSTFIAADCPGVSGAWVGCGSFSACYLGARFAMHFRPAGSTERALVFIPAQTVRDFIEHTCRYVEPDDEAAANLKAVDTAIERILRG